MTIIYAILMFCLLIFVHELGHFWAARACDVKVNEFALGMGPTALKRKKGETTYALRVFPIGGFCAMEGENEDSEDPRAFNHKPAWKRAIILFAGSTMNFLLCVLILFIIALYAGTVTTTIDQVSPGSPAQKAGLKAGDQIVKIDQKEIKEWEDITTAIEQAETTFDVKVKRDGQTLTMNSGFTKEKDGRKIIGVTPVRNHNPLTAAADGCRNTWEMTKMMGDILSKLFTGKVSAKELTGPVGIVYAVSDTAKYGFIYLLYLTALISLNLGIVNLLPLPALDGGRLLFLVIRKITGKAVTDEMEGRIHFIGIMLLFGLMIYVTWNDIVRFIVPGFK